MALVPKAALDPEWVSIIGFGSLLSRRSSELTFPRLRNFRLGRLSCRTHRRVFGHPAPIFFERGIARMETREMSSLAVEEVRPAHQVSGASDTSYMYVTLFDIHIEERPAFEQREEEFRVEEAEALELDSDARVRGLLCLRSTDAAVIEKLGRQHFEERYKRHGIETIWHWEEESVVGQALPAEDSTDAGGTSRGSSGVDPSRLVIGGLSEDALSAPGMPKLLPCRLYLRHCLLAAKGWGQDAYDNFLDTTWLSNRRNRLRDYIESNEEAIFSIPDGLPESLRERYGG